MLTIEQCTKILNQNNNVRYTKENIKAIREFLYAMAQLQYETKKELSIKIQNNNSDETNVIIYCRVSTDEHRLGTSVDVQE